MKYIKKDIHQVKNLFLLLVIISGLMVGCNSNRYRNSHESAPTDSSIFDDGILTTQKAENALEKWAIGARASDCSGNCKVSIVGGVRELPQQNLAVAELKFSEFIYQPRNENVKRIYSEKGSATFTHYTDGRWVLTNVLMGDTLYGGTQWKPEIEAQ